MADPNIPHTMRAVRLTAYDGVEALEVRDVPVPWPGPSQVLVKVHAAPVLPSDRMFCSGAYGARRTLPTTPGIEGMGTVVARGSGAVGRLLLGRRVAFLADPQHNGSWAEYAVVGAGMCVPLWSSAGDEAAASLLFNPVITLTLLDQMKSHGHRALFVTGAGGSLGRMLIRMGLAEGMTIVAITRRAEWAASLSELGAAEVFLEDDPDLEAKLRRSCRAWRVTAAIDAVGGDVSGKIFSSLPDGGELLVLGLRAGDTLPISARQLIFHNKRVRGFWLASYLEQHGTTVLLRALPRLRRYASDELRTQVSERVRLDEVPDALGRRLRGVSKGKMLILPHAERG